MQNETNNIIIQGVTDSTLTLNVNGTVREIHNQLADLKALLQNLKAPTVQYADKIYNIEHINEANFGVMTSNRVFNGVLTKELIHFLGDRTNARQFLNGIPAEDKQNWECVRLHLKEAQGLLGDSYVWVIGWELRRLFSIGNDRQKSMEIKVDEYINHCFSTYRLSLQLVNYLFLSKLWDAKKTQKKNIDANKKPLTDFFHTKRLLKLTELRTLFHTLLEIFRDNDLDFPLEEMEAANIHPYLQPDSAFNKACASMEALEALGEQGEKYGLGHCHSAEISLATILQAFPFFTTHQLVTMKKVEYEETRNTTPRYIKDFSILEKKEAQNLQRILNYDNKPSLTYALFFRNGRNAINLFPFLLDFNALTNEQDFQIYFYESRNGNSGLRYFSIKNEKEDSIHYRAAATDAREILSEEQKNAEQKIIRLDLVIRQFEDALNTVLDADVRFEAIDSTPKVDNTFNF